MSLVESRVVTQWLLDNIDASIGTTDVERLKHVKLGPPRPPSTDATRTDAIVDPSVFVIADGGEDTLRRADWREESPGYSFIVRSPPRNYDAGAALVDECVRIASNLCPPDFFDCKVAGGRAHYLREDAQQAHLWSINVALKKSA